MPEDTYNVAYIMIAYRISIILFAAVVIAFSAVAFHTNHVWYDDILLWTDVAKKSPNEARPYTNLGAAFLRADKYDDAINFLQISIKIDPYYIEPHYDLAICYIKMRYLDKAIPELEEVTRINSVLRSGHYNMQDAPKFDLQAHSNLGNIYNVKRMFDKAVFHYREALNIEPNDISTRFNLALTYEIMGMLQEARAEFEEVLKINPADEGAKRAVERLEAISPHASGGQRQ